MSAFPPHRSTESLPVTQDVALKYLSTYLTATKTNPHLLPNARLEPSGPTSGSSNSSITIHNLQRVEAGLRGEWMAPSLELDESGVNVTKGMDDGTNKGTEAAEAEGEGWMDLDQYQREQSIEGGDMGLSGATVIGQEGDSDLEGEVVIKKDAEDEDAPVTKKLKTKHQPIQKNTVADKPVDKLARKAEKKARMKAERVAKEQERQAAAAN